MFRDMQNGLLGSLGMRVISSKYCFTEKQDWLGCRSIPRAKRRHARGIKTRMVIREIPTVNIINGKMYAHPSVISAIEENI